MSSALGENLEMTPLPRMYRSSMQCVAAGPTSFTLHEHTFIRQKILEDAESIRIEVLEGVEEDSMSEGGHLLRAFQDSIINCVITKKLKHIFSPEEKNLDEGLGDCRLVLGIFEIKLGEGVPGILVHMAEVVVEDSTDERTNAFFSTTIARHC